MIIIMGRSGNGKYEFSSALNILLVSEFESLSIYLSDCSVYLTVWPPTSVCQCSVYW